MATSSDDSPAPFSVDGSTLSWRGRVQKHVDAKSFELLSEGHARDKDAVYFAMETKLKPIKHADPTGFVSLGKSYGYDGNRAFFEAKTLRLKKGAGGAFGQMRELSRYYATDGAWLYFGTAHCDPPAGDFDWSVAAYRPFWENAVNRANAVLSDGNAHFFHGWNDGWVAMEAVDIDRLRLLDDELTASGPGRFFTDEARVFYRGRVIAGADPATARAIGRDVLEDSTRVFAGTGAIPFEPGELRLSGGDIYCSDGHVHRIEPDQPPKELSARGSWVSPTVEEASLRLQELLLPPACAAFDRHLPVEDAPLDLDFTAELAGPIPAASVPADPERWFSHLVTTWAKDRGRPDRLLAFINYGTGYPDADALLTRMMKKEPAGFVDLVAALEADGRTSSACLMAHGLLARARAELAPRELSRLPLIAVPESTHRERKWSFTVTTNLGVAKHVVASGMMEDPDPRARWEAANLVCGILRASNKTESIFKVVLDPLLDRCAAETGVLQDVWLLTLEAAAVAATVSADMGRAYPYRALERIARSLIANGVNVAISQVRLVEALFGQGRDAEADAIAIDHEGALPGPFMYRERCASPEAAVAAAKERARPARKEC